MKRKYLKEKQVLGKPFRVIIALRRKPNRDGSCFNYVSLSWKNKIYCSLKKNLSFKRTPCIKNHYMTCEVPLLSNNIQISFVLILIAEHCRYKSVFPNFHLTSHNHNVFVTNFLLTGNVFICERWHG